MSKKSLQGRDFLSMRDISRGELEHILETAGMQKKKKPRRSLKGKHVAMLFEKPSLRTKVSFDVAIRQLGGHVVYMGQQEVGLGERESIADASRTLSRFVDAIVARTFAHSTLESLAEHSGIPVINALSEDEHPCQALADLLTMQEHKGSVAGLRIVYVGDGNNVASSLALGASMLGGNFVIASPKGYELPSIVIRETERRARSSGGSYTAAPSVDDALADADVVYTDVWTSMGDEASDARTTAFREYQITPERMALAKSDAIFMHDLPAHRGEEVHDDVLDGPQSVVFDQAENRLHAQRALLHLLLSR